MVTASARNERRTSVDDVFDHLHEQIVTLQLRPGDRISEAEIAAHFGVSRQPVRDAFSRLANLDLLMIRPQQKKMKEHRAMVEALSRGDQVVTQGGLIGKITKVKEDNEVEVEIATGVKVRVVQSTIVNVLNKTEPRES